MCYLGARIASLKLGEKYNCALIGELHFHFYGESGTSCPLLHTDGLRTPHADCLLDSNSIG